MPITTDGTYLVGDFEPVAVACHPNTEFHARGQLCGWPVVLDWNVPEGKLVPVPLQFLQDHPELGVSF